MQDEFGDRMKMYEGIEAGRRFMPLLPIVARIDGRAFSKFTKGMDRPYDQRMTDAMIETTRYLVDETGACMGYTQSDEISLVWHSTDIESKLWFDGRICKMVSQLAAQATLAFYLEVLRTMPEYADRGPTFDARAWQVPNRTEGANAILWREWDAKKNSISMAAAEHFSPKQLHKKSGLDKIAMLAAKGVSWKDYPTSFKLGTFVQRQRLSTPFTIEEIDALPPKHAARKDPYLVVERSRIVVLDMPPFGTVANREAVVFDGATPEVVK